MSVVQTMLNERPSWIGDEAFTMLHEGPSAVCWSIDTLGMHVAEMDIHNLLLVVDQAAVGAAGLGRDIARQLSGCRFELFDSFEPNPRWQSGAAAARLAAEIDADAVLAVGGGSCCDVAKIAALGARTPGLIDSLAQGGSADRADPLPLIATPTTSGTGSEATHFAAIYVDGRKISVAHPRLLPRVAVLDERFHLTMPAVLAASSGLDAMCQAMESLWAVGATGDSRRYAMTGGRMIAEHLVESVQHGRAESRRAMMVGAHLAGRAINVSKTTASHALSYQLTQRYGLQHGHAVALTVGFLGRANSVIGNDDCILPAGFEAARLRVEEAASLLGVMPAALPARVRGLLRDLGLASTLAEAGVERSVLQSLAEAIDPVRLGNNPRRMTVGQIESMLVEAFEGE